MSVSDVFFGGDEEKKEEDMTPEELEKKAEEDAYKMEIQSNSWKNWPKDREHTEKLRS